MWLKKTLVTHNHGLNESTLIYVKSQKLDLTNKKNMDVTTTQNWNFTNSKVDLYFILYIFIYQVYQKQIKYMTFARYLQKRG
jgi:hypothetical protein